MHVTLIIIVSLDRGGQPKWAKPALVLGDTFGSSGIPSCNKQYGL